LFRVVENYLVAPLVQQQMVNMPPVLMIAAVRGEGGSASLPLGSDVNHGNGTRCDYVLWDADDLTDSPTA
jgi:hypothetical protein